MNKWLLLAFSAFAVYGVIEAVRWLHMMKKKPIQDIEKVTGIDGSRLDPASRDFMADRSLKKFVMILLMFALSMVAATIRAFLYIRELGFLPSSHE